MAPADYPYEPEHRAELRIGKRAGGAALATLGWLRERTLAPFEVSGLSVALERFSVLIEGAVFAALFHEVGPRRTGERLAVFTHRPSRTGALGNGGSNAEQQKQSQGCDRPAHFACRDTWQVFFRAHPNCTDVLTRLDMKSARWCRFRPR